MAKVLVVDDEPVILDLLRETLAGDGAQVVLARDGDTALRRLREETFDVVLVDLMMPKVTGWGVLEQVGAHPGWPRVIVVSARTGAEEKRRAFDLGAVDVVGKPFEPEALSRLVAAVAALGPDEVDGHRLAARAREGV